MSLSFEVLINHGVWRSLRTVLYRFSLDSIPHGRQELQTGVLYRVLYIITITISKGGCNFIGYTMKTLEIFKQSGY